MTDNQQSNYKYVHTFYLQISLTIYKIENIPLATYWGATRMKDYIVKDYFLLSHISVMLVGLPISIAIAIITFVTSK